MIDAAFFAELPQVEHVTCAYWISSSALRGRLPDDDSGPALLVDSARELVSLSRCCPYPDLKTAAARTVSDLGLSVVVVPVSGAVFTEPCDVEPA